MADPRADRNSSDYAQAIFQNAQAAKLTSTYNQLATAWNYLDFEFRRNIPEPTTHTTAAEVLAQFDSKANIWHELARRRPSTERQAASRQLDLIDIHVRSHRALAGSRDPFHPFLINRDMVSHICGSRLDLLLSSRLITL